MRKVIEARLRSVLRRRALPRDDTYGSRDELIADRVTALRSCVLEQLSISSMELTRTWRERL